MNLYLLSFLAYAILIVPVKVHILLGYDVKNGFQFEIQFAGIKLMRKSREKRNEGNLSAKASFASVVLAKDQLRKIIRSVELKQIKIDALVSFQDAAQTALIYSLICICLQVVKNCGFMQVEGDIRMNFNGKEAMASIECIASARLGSIGIAAMRLGLAAAHRRMMAEEEKNAASY